MRAVYFKNPSTNLLAADVEPFDQEMIPPDEEK